MNRTTYVVSVLVVAAIIFALIDMNEGCAPTTTTTTTKPCDVTAEICQAWAEEACCDLGVDWWDFDDMTCKCTYECKPKPTTTTTKCTTTTTEPTTTTTTTKCTTTTTHPEETTTTTTQPTTPTTLARTDRVVGQSTCVCGGHAPAINATPYVHWCHNPECWCLPNYKECLTEDGLPKGAIVKHFLETCECPTDKGGIDPYFYTTECRTKHVSTVCVQLGTGLGGNNILHKCYPTEYIRYWHPEFVVKECTPQGGFIVEYYLGIPRNILDMIVSVR